MFFKNLPYVLPCKFCRASLADYYFVDPVPTSGYAEWLYRIHNRVNGKLRDQKLMDTPNPSWKDIRARYTQLLRKPCSVHAMIGWDFLFSIAYTTPCSVVTTSPMPNAPPKESLPTPELRNRWGVMTRAERLPYIHAWWKSLPHVLPYKLWRNTWVDVVPSMPNPEKGRKAITAWLYTAERNMCTALQEQTKHTSYSGLCSELKIFASGCGKSRGRSVTCRSKARRMFTRKRKPDNT